MPGGNWTTSVAINKGGTISDFLQPESRPRATAANIHKVTFRHNDIGFIISSTNLKYKQGGILSFCHPEPFDTPALRAGYSG